MAITIGDALLTLGVDTKDLDKGMKGLGANIKKHQKAIGIGMAAAGATILATGALSVKAFAEMGDEVHKMALRTGFATETLSRLKFAAQIGGATLSDVEKSVKKMAMSISDAKDGLATYTREFEKIGINVEELEGMSPEDQWMKLALAVAALEDPLQRASSAQKIFGRAGTAMLPMLAEGEEGLRDMMKRAEEFAPIFDKEASEAAAKFTDNMLKLTGSTDKVKFAIANNLMPILIPLIEQITGVIGKVIEWTKENPKLTRAIILGGMAFGVLLTVFGSLLVILPLLSAAVGAFGLTLATAILPITLIVLAVGALIAIGVLLILHWDKVKLFFIGMWLTLVDVFNMAWASIKSRTIDPLLEAATWVKTAWESIVPFFEGLLVSIRSIFNQIGKSMYEPIKRAIDWIINMVNRMIRSINRATSKLGISIPTIPFSMPDLPKFATGGIAMRPMVAQIAERGPEAVIPLSKLGNIMGDKSVNIFVELDGKTIARAIGAPLVDLIRVKTGVRI